MVAVVVGVQSSREMNATFWMDGCNEVAWLRALEQLAVGPGRVAYAVVREPHIRHPCMAGPVRGVTYVFASTDAAIPGLVCQLKPSLVLYDSCCCHSTLAACMQAVAAAQEGPGTRQLVRVPQHRGGAVLPEQVIRLCSAIVVPSFADVAAVEAHGPRPLGRPVHVVPIGADVRLVQALPAPEQRDIDFAVASCQDDGGLLPHLIDNGFRVADLTGKQRAEALALLKRAHVCVMASTSHQARLLLSAAAAGAFQWCRPSARVLWRWSTSWGAPCSTCCSSHWTRSCRAWPTSQHLQRSIPSPSLLKMLPNTLLKLRSAAWCTSCVLASSSAGLQHTTCRCGPS